MRLGSVTARHSGSGRQPKFAALNRVRHLYSAGRPSRRVLAHILVINSFDVCLQCHQRLKNEVSFRDMMGETYLFDGRVSQLKCEDVGGPGFDILTSGHQISMTHSLS